MSVDFDKLWEDKYSEGFASFARRHEYLLQGYGTAEDLYQDLWLNVWQNKVVPHWENYTQKSKNPDFDRFVSYLLNHYILDIKRKYHTRPRKFQREQESLDKPVTTEDGSEAKIEDFVGAVDRGLQDLEDESEVEGILSSISDPEVRKAVEIIVSNDLPPTQLWAKIREELGHSRTYFQDKMRKEPALRSLLEKVSAK